MRHPRAFLAAACLLAGAALPAQTNLYTLVGNLDGSVDHAHTFNNYGGRYAQSFTTGAGPLPDNVDSDGNNIPYLVLGWRLAPGTYYSPAEDAFLPGATTYALQIRADNAGVPGAVLVDFDQVEVTAESVVFGSFMNFGSFSFQPLTTYWAVATFASGFVAFPPDFLATDDPVDTGLGTFGPLMFGDGQGSFFARDGQALLSIGYEHDPAAVPEPSTVALGLGALGLACLVRRRRR